MVSSAYQNDLRKICGVDRLGEEAGVALEIEVEPAVLVDERREPAELAGRAERRQHHDQRRDREEDEQIERAAAR